MRRRSVGSQRMLQRQVQAALEAQPVDVRTLRQLCFAPRGLGRQQLRAKAWPRLLGVSPRLILPLTRKPDRGGGGRDCGCSRGTAV